MKTHSSLLLLLAQPTPEALWLLRGELLTANLPADSPVWSLLGQFYLFLNELTARASSREYSHFASMLDIAAVGGVALQNILAEAATDEETRHIGQRLLAGAFSEGLMVLAARQYVKAWEGEMAASYRAAAWELYGELWNISTEMKPELPAVERRQLLDNLLAPLQDAGQSGTVKAALIARFYQLLLLIHLQSGAMNT